MSKFNFDAVIFNLDGVITKTAMLHAAAWKAMFDEFLKAWELKTGKPYVEFTHTYDYLPYIDGRTRYEGVEAFLKSRGVEIPYGNITDEVDKATICGLGNKKNKVFNDMLQRNGVEVYKTTIALMDELKNNGIKLGVSSSSKNCRQILEKANLMHYFDTRVDGEVLAELGLKGKPEPHIFTIACDFLGVPRFRAVIIDDAVPGMLAAQKGNFGFVIGIDRDNNAYEFKSNGADIVLTDVEEINGIKGLNKWFDKDMNTELWSVSFFGHNKATEQARETILSTGNGYFTSAGTLEEFDENPADHCVAYMANPKKADSLKTSSPCYLASPNWLPITFKVAEGDWFNPAVDELVELEQTLNLRGGVLIKKLIARDNDGRETLVETRRFASMDNRHHASIDYSLTPLNYTDYIRVKSTLNATDSQGNKPNNLKPVKQWGKDNISCILVKNEKWNVDIAVAAKLEVFYENSPLATNYRIKDEDGRVNTYIKASVREGETLRVEKLVTICNSITNANPLDFVEKDVNELNTWGIMHAASLKVWEKLWEKADIHITGDRLAQKLARLDIYHSILLSQAKNIYQNHDADLPYTLHNTNIDEVFKALSELGLHFPVTSINKSIEIYKKHNLGKFLIGHWLLTHISKKDGALEQTLDFLINDAKQHGSSSDVAITASVHAIITYFTSLKVDSNKLSINPNLPRYWNEVVFSTNLSGKDYKIWIKQDKLKIKGDDSEVVVCDKPHKLVANEVLEVALD
jgi:beta-phosphoglucomutase family hydrolase